MLSKLSLMSSHQYNNAYNKVHPDNIITPVFQNYKSAMSYLYKDCHRDEFGLLVEDCESGKCEQWSNNFQVIKSHIEQAKLGNSKGFVRFEYIKKGDERKLDLVQDPLKATEIVEYIEKKLKDFVAHSTYCKQEPQSMYWVRKQVSLHCGVGSCKTHGVLQKIYFGHFSEDRTHCQGYINLSVIDCVQELSVTESLILRSDNASNFKCAEHFYDMQQLSNSCSSNIIRVYGAAGHSKSEVDSCGGHMKNPPRKHIAKGNILRSASDVCRHLINKYDQDKYQNPTYCPRVISESDLEIEREKRRFMRFDTVAGSDSFHVVIFRPNQDFFLASKRLCVCDSCMAMEFESCANFQMYVPSVGKLSKKQLRSAPSTQQIASEKVTIIANSVVAVLADSLSDNYFLIMCDEDERVHNDPITPLKDNMGHEIYDGQSYVKGRYLEYKTMNNKCHIYTVSRLTVYVRRESIFLLYVTILDTTKSNIKIFNEIILELQVRSAL